MSLVETVNTQHPNEDSAKINPLSQSSNLSLDGGFFDYFDFIFPPATLHPPLPTHHFYFILFLLVHRKGFWTKEERCNGSSTILHRKDRHPFGQIHHVELRRDRVRRPLGTPTHPLFPFLLHVSNFTKMMAVEVHRDLSI